MYLAIDIGGTKTLAGLIDKNGEVIETTRFETPKNYNQFISDLKKAVDEITTNYSKLRGCCIAIPGLIDREKGLVRALGNLPWKNKPIRSDLQKFINTDNILLENDSRLAGLAEANVVRFSYDSILYLTVSTGIGGALIKYGKIVTELQDTEMGKMPLLYDGKVQSWEEFASGRWVVAEFDKKASQIDNAGTLKKIGHNIAYGLGAVCAVLQPQAIIFGGGVGQYADKFSEYISEYLMANLHPVIKHPQALLSPSYPDDAVLHGCFLYLQQNTDD